MNKKFTDLLGVSKKKANKWLDSNIDSKSKNEIIQLLHKKNQKLLLECFYKNLEFGTGGMRGIIGIGSGGNYALAAAKVLMESKMSAEEIAKKSIQVASEICVFTNNNITLEKI